MSGRPTDGCGVWGRLASLGPSEHQTPHQWGTELADAIPQQRAAVLSIVNAYALHTYAGRSPAGAPDIDGIAQAWKAVRGPLALHALRRREL